MRNSIKSFCIAAAIALAMSGLAFSQTFEGPNPGMSAMGMVGPVMSLPNTQGFIGNWTVGRTTVHVSATTILDQHHGNVAIGALVEVVGTRKLDGSIDATKIIVRWVMHPFPTPSPRPSPLPSPGPLCFTFIGPIQTLPNTAGFVGEWRVGGMAVHVTSTTTIKQEQGTVAIGNFVSIKGCLGANRSINADSIEVVRRPTLPPPPTFIFFGNVQTLPNTDGLIGDWTVSGRTVHVTADTRVERTLRPLVIGALVRVMGDLRTDGTVDARGIHVIRNTSTGREVNFFELHGKVNVLPTTPNLIGDWTVNNLTVHVSERTRIHQPPSHPIAVGSRVVVVGTQRADLTVDAARIVALPPINNAQNFVAQNYSDFLNREPDIQGLSFWSNEIESCGLDAACVDAKRVNTSAAFFLSIEFQNTGYLVYRSYVASFGRIPRFAEFLPDVQKIGQNVVVGAYGWQDAMSANKLGFAEEWVEHPAFEAIYDGKSNAQYVDMLFANAGVTPRLSDRNALITGLSNGSETRASVLLKVADDPTFTRAEFNRAFVLMQYFGYLRRDPDDGPDTNLDGFNFWLNKLNQFNGDFNKAEMVRAFILSDEYRGRFEPQ